MMALRSIWTLNGRDPGLELIDGPLESKLELSESFRDIALANRWFGGTSAARAGLRGIDARTVLDVACGIADIPITLSKESRANGRAISVTCLDLNAELLRFAEHRAGDDRSISFVHGDGTRLPFEDGAFDVVMCNLALHHLAEDEAVALLREMRRVARITPLVTDLSRSVLTWLAAYAFSRVFSRNRLTRHDAPLSARRAYTPAEARALALRAGWRAPRVKSHRFIRMVLTDAPSV